jgi:hypothetical protein
VSLKSFLSKLLDIGSRRLPIPIALVPAVIEVGEAVVDEISEAFAAPSGSTGPLSDRDVKVQLDAAMGPFVKTIGHPTPPRPKRKS